MKWQSAFYKKLQKNIGGIQGVCVVQQEMKIEVREANGEKYEDSNYTWSKS